MAIDLEEQHDKIYRYRRRELDRWELAAVQAGYIRRWAWGLVPAAAFAAGVEIIMNVKGREPQWS